MKHQTCLFFIWSTNRTASIRIPRETDKKRYGYIEDRRPSGSANMYVVTAKLLKLMSLRLSYTVEEPISLLTLLCPLAARLRFLSSVLAVVLMLSLCDLLERLKLTRWKSEC